MPTLTRLVQFAALSGLSCLALQALAGEDKPSYDRIAFSVSAEARADNDTLSAVLYSSKEGPELAPLSSEVNKAIAAAVKRAKQEAGVTVQTLDYQTYPSYDKGRPSGWQVRQSLRLESKSPEQIAKLIGDLQSSLALGSVGYSISPERLKEHEDKLIDQALTAFKARAERITKDLGRAQYRIVQVQVENAGNSPTPRPMRMMAMADAAPAAAPPTLEAGQETVRVQVNGTIELQPM
jgi:predicted secreted protein